MASRNDIEINQEGVLALLQSQEIIDINQRVAERIMTKDKLRAPDYSYEELGVRGNRQVGGIFRNEEGSYFREVMDGKLKKAARSRLGEIGE